MGHFSSGKPASQPVSAAMQHRRAVPVRWQRCLLAVGLGLGTILAGSGLAQTDAPAVTEPLSTPAPGLNSDYQFLVTFPTFGQFDSGFLGQIDAATLRDDEDISETHLTLPSLWINRDVMPNRLGGRRLVNSWLAYQVKSPQIQVVDVVVNTQYWSVLNYLEQYGVLLQLGSAAKDYGYNLRIFRGSAFSRELVGLQVCEFPPIALTRTLLPLNEQGATIPCRATLDILQLRGFENNGSTLFGN